MHTLVLGLVFCHLVSGTPTPRGFQETGPEDVLDLVEALREASTTGDEEWVGELRARALELLAELGSTPDTAEAVAAASSELARAARDLGDVELELEARIHAVAVLEPWSEPSAGTLQERRRDVVRLLMREDRYEEALPWVETIAEVCDASLPLTAPDRVEAHAVLATVLRLKGAPERAVEAYRRVIDELGEPSATNGATLGHLHHNLGAVLADDLERVDEAVRHFELSLAAYGTALEPEDPQVIRVHHDLAIVLDRGGKVAEALPHYRLVHRIHVRDLPPDDLARIRVTADLGYALYELQELVEAASVLAEAVEAYERVLLPGDDELWTFRRTLAHVDELRGDFVAARELRGRVLEDAVRSGAPEADRDFARMELATTLAQMGDHPQALALRRTVLEHAEASRPEDDPFTLEARRRVAESLADVGDFAGALAIYEVLEPLLEGRRGADDPTLFQCRRGLAFVLWNLGRLDEAEALQRKLLAQEVRLRGPEALSVQWRRFALAATLRSRGEPAEALELERTALARISERLPATHPYALDARLRLARSLALVREETELAGLLASTVEAREAWTAQVALLSPRESRQLVSARRSDLSLLLSLLEFVPSPEGLEERCFELLETSRHLASLGTPALGGTDESLDEIHRLREEIHELVNGPADRERDLGAELSSLVETRDRVEARLRRKLAEAGGGPPSIEIRTLARSLPPAGAAVGFARYQRWRPGEEPGSAPTLVDAFLAHVLFPSGELVRVELGPAAEIEERVLAWRRTVESRFAGARDEDGSRELERAGEALRALVLDPVLTVTGEADPLWICLDDVLHLVPWDALPAGDGRVGDRRRLRLAPSFRPPASRPGSAQETGAELVLVGGVDFDAEVEPAPPELSTVSAYRSAGGASYGALPQTRGEIEALRSLYEATLAGDVLVLSGSDATKRALRPAAEGARFLHLATHGYFASDAAANPAQPSPAGGLRSLAPLTSCGLALAGANRTDPGGRVPGILTGEELAGYDLSRCELAVLSACETNVGLPRAGQGLSSLQSALHAAGVRWAVTSLWKVHDAQARRFMEELYRRVWKEGQGVAEALWATKRSMERARLDVFDWGSWVLTGNPR